MISSMHRYDIICDDTVSWYWCLVSILHDTCILIHKRALTFNTLWGNSADDRFMIFFLFFHENRLWHSCKLSPQETISMKCQSLFSGENKKNIPNCHLLKFLPSMLRITIVFIYYVQKYRKTNTRTLDIVIISRYLFFWWYPALHKAS